MDVIFLEMSVMLMVLALLPLVPESCPSKRGKRLPSSGFLHSMSVWLQPQLAGQPRTATQESPQTLQSKKTCQKPHFGGAQKSEVSIAACLLLGLGGVSNGGRGEI